MRLRRVYMLIISFQMLITEISALTLIITVIKIIIVKSFEFYTKNEYQVLFGH